MEDQEAMKAVQKGDIGINRAAKEYGVHRTTLKDRVSGRVKHGTKSGPQPYLSVDEETELAKFVKQCAEVGYGKTRKNVMHLAQSVANEKGIIRKAQISHGWWARFIERQQDLSLRRGDSAAHDRMNAVNQIGDRSSETNMVVSKYLVRPSDTPSMKKSLPRARLLTTASVLTGLEEKERNKRQAIEEKEKER